MRNVEKYVFWISILSLIVSVAGLLGVWSMLRASSLEEIDLNARVSKFGFQFVFTFLPNIAAAFWLVWAAQSKRLKKLPWALLGIAHGLWGVALFYVLLCYFELLLIKKRISLNET